jgi:hypothetical protein
MNKATRRKRATLRWRAAIGRGRHYREVWRKGDEGWRCYGCISVPFHPWEYPTQEQAEHAYSMALRSWEMGLLRGQ